MDRRLFMTASAGCVVTAWIGRVFASSPVCAACEARAARPQPAIAIAIVDPSLPESVTCASAAARDGARIVECVSDVALLWYEVLAHSHVPLVGVLRASDFFVLRHLARSDGRAVAHEAGASTVVFRIVAVSAGGSR